MLQRKLVASILIISLAFHSFAYSADAGALTTQDVLDNLNAYYQYEGIPQDEIKHTYMYNFLNTPQTPPLDQAALIAINNALMPVATNATTRSYIFMDLGVFNSAVNMLEANFPASFFRIE